MMVELDLSAQQQDAIAALRVQQEEKLAPVRTKLDSLRVKLHAAWSAPNPNASEIQALHKQMDPLRQQLRQANVDLRLDVLEILTPAQRAKYTQAMKNRGPGKGMRGRGMGRGAGCPWAVDQGMSSPGW
jgi:Spy/CpxP family protein refolding chaperone